MMKSSDHWSDDPEAGKPERDTHLAADAVTLRELHRLTSDRSLGFPEKVTAILQLGCRQFGMGMGVLARVEGQRYEVVAVVGTEAVIQEGETYELQDTYGSAPIERGEPVSFERATGSEWESHPFHRRTGLEAYLGSPVVVGDRLFGTLSFASLRPRSRAFAESERDLTHLMAHWLGGELERRQAEEALRASEAKFSGILKIAADAIISVDENQRIVLFNKGAEDIFGYSREEMLGRPLDVLLPERVRDRHGAHIRDFASSTIGARRMGERQEISGRRRNGDEFPAEASISKLETPEGMIFTVVLRDVADRARAQDQLARTAQELARSNAELEQFAYVASHDLQEPLRMVASYTQLLARRYRGKLDEDADEFIGYAVDGVDRMRTLINDLLVYSRAGRRLDEPEPVDLNAVVDRTLKNLEVLLEETEGTVTTDPLPTIVGDEVKLAQLFENLIGNALKFRGEGPPRVHVSADRLEEEHVISVRDNGIGFDPEHLDRIFVMFQRLHNRRDYPGTGIGLAIAKKIVELHGGRLWAVSEPGHGSTFHFTLPQGVETWPA